jgi:DNA-binding transcriptional regulator YdaS (Cro superfamily)
VKTKLADYLAASGLSQTDFARLSGIPAPMICQYASGVRRPGVDSALAIEEATDGAVPVECWRHTPKRGRRTVV